MTQARLRILVIAYEYPPVESAHGLRWGYLSRELCSQGHDVCVVTAAVLGPSHTSSGFEQAAVVRIFPGPFVGVTGNVSRRLRRSEQSAGGHDVGQPPGIIERSYRLLRKLLNQVPDIRTEWLPWGLAAAKRAIDENRPDVIIASHEPGVDLAIARRLQRRYGIPVVADLGDPVVSPYTPRWRRWLDARFERRWLADVAAVSVTTEQTRQLLRTRIPNLRKVPIEVLTQGFDVHTRLSGSTRNSLSFDPERLEMLYTGTLYARFRSPASLLKALQQVPGVRLTVAGHLDGIDPGLLERDGSVRYVGRLSHAQAREAQRQADVLLNIGNDFGVQMPGKLFEYLGAGRPILHLSSVSDDASAEIVRDLECGVVVRSDDIPGMVGALKVMQSVKASGEMSDSCSNLRMQYSWQSIAARLESLLVSLVESNGIGASRAPGFPEQRPK